MLRRGASAVYNGAATPQQLVYSATRAAHIIRSGSCSFVEKKVKADDKRNSLLFYKHLELPLPDKLYYLVLKDVRICTEVARNGDNMQMGYFFNISVYIK